MVSKGERTRENIVRQAAIIFNTHGYAGTSLSDIMRLTGLEKGGIYNHFSSKDELAFAAFDYAISLTTERIRAIFSTHRHAIDRLHALLDYYFEVARGDTIAGGCPILNTAIESDDAYPELKAKAREAMKSLVDTVQRLIEKGKERGEIRVDADGGRAAIFIISTMEGAVMMAKLYDDEQPLHTAVEQVCAFIESRLRPLGSSE